MKIIALVARRGNPFSNLLYQQLREVQPPECRRSTTPRSTTSACTRRPSATSRMKVRNCWSRSTSRRCHTSKSPLLPGRLRASTNQTFPHFNWTELIITHVRFQIRKTNWQHTVPLNKTRTGPARLNGTEWRMEKLTSALFGQGADKKETPVLRFLINRRNVF